MLFKTNYPGMEQVNVSEDMLKQLKQGSCMSWHNNSTGVDSPLMQINSVDMKKRTINMQVAEFELKR